MNRMLNKDQEYINWITEGLPANEHNSGHLHSILASAWDNKHNLKFARGRLAYNEMSLLPDGTETAAANQYDQEKSTIEAICQHSWAKKYSYFFLAQAWGARHSVKGLTRNDVSRFDYNRVQTAQKSCKACTEKSGGMLLVKGGVSGIQNFIYHNIQAEQIGDARNVGKKLRGRSFFITIVGDILAEHIIENLGLEQANILFVGGGHFNLLLPDTEQMLDKLNEIHRNINNDFLNDFGLGLSVTMAHVSIQEGNNDYAGAFKNVTDILESQKQKKYINQLTDVFSRKFPYDAGDAIVEDAMKNLGQYVPRAGFLVEIKGDNPARAKFRGGAGSNNESSLFFSFSATQADYYLHPVNAGEDTETIHWQKLANFLTEGLKAINPDDLNIKIIRLNSTNFLPPAELSHLFKDLPAGYGFRFLGQHTPVYESDISASEDKLEGNIMTFEDLAKPKENDEAYQQLAALRLDVDDLGALFALGLGKNPGLETISSLSREIQYFFAGYINILAKKHEIYVVYSGGDDAFLIGRWYNILLFAQALREQFGKLSNNNPNLGFSAGIFTCHPSYPLALLGYKAGEQEHKAKKFRQNGELLKNAVCVFDHTVSWERFNTMMAFYRAMFHFVEKQGTGSSGKRGIKRSVLQHLLKVIQASVTDTDSGFYCGEEKKGTNVADDHFEFYRNIGRLHALLARRGYFDEENKGEDGKLSDLISTMLKDMADFEIFADYLIPFNILLYRTRT